MLFRFVLFVSLICAGRHHQLLQLNVPKLMLKIVLELFVLIKESVAHGSYTHLVTTVFDALFNQADDIKITHVVYIGILLITIQIIILSF